MKLGRKPSRFTAASLRRSHVISKALSALGPPPAVSPDWVSAVMKQSPLGFGMDGNDNYGDCVIADCAHQEMIRTANVGAIWAPTLTQILALYAYFQGYKGDPSNLQAIEAYLKHNDDGCDELSVIRYLTQIGWLGRRLNGHANLDVTQFDEIKWAVCIFGASRLGLNLPDSAMDQFEKGEPWTPVTNAQLAGGHDVPVVKYDGDYFYIVTWGKVHPVTPTFLTAQYPNGTPYLEEAHAELAFDWVNAAGTCPANLNLEELVANLTAITEPPLPPPTPPPSTSKHELGWLVIDAVHADVKNAQMDEAAMKADLINLINGN